MGIHGESGVHAVENYPSILGSGVMRDDQPLASDLARSSSLAAATS